MALNPLIASDQPIPATPPTAELPAPPVPPTSISFSNIPAWIVYFGSLAIFVVGLLTALGHTLPTNVSTEVQTWAGVAPMIAALVAPIIALLSHQSVQKAAVSSPTTVVVPPPPQPPLAPQAAQAAQAAAAQAAQAAQSAQAAAAQAAAAQAALAAQAAEASAAQATAAKGEDEGGDQGTTN